MTIHGCKLKVERDLGRERNLLVLPQLKILAHQVMERNMGLEGIKKNISEQH